MIQLKKWYQNEVHKGISLLAKSIRKILAANKPLEAVSVDLIQDLLVHAFGYKKDWLEPQENISNKHVDIAIHYPQAGIMCEGKKYDAAKSQLNEKARKQLDVYCRTNVCEWGILTDGIRWEFYWYPQGKTKKNRQKIAEANFTDLPKRITSQYCEKFHIFHAEFSPQNRREYAKTKDTISPDNVIVWLRSEECFKALCKVIQKKENKKQKEMNKLALHIYKCFEKVLPLPEGRNNPFDLMKRKKKKKTNKTIETSATEQELTETQAAL